MNFEATQKTEYGVYYSESYAPDKVFLYKIVPDLDAAEKMVKEMKEYPFWTGCDIRVREKVSKINWYKYI